MKLKAFAWACASDHRPEGYFMSIMGSDPTGCSGVLKAWPIEIDFEVPSDFNPVAEEIAAIEREKAAALDEFQETVASCNERLSKLQAITNEVQA